MTGTWWLDLETREYFERNIEELRERPILNINRVKDAPLDWPYLMGVPITVFKDSAICFKAQIIDCKRWHVNGHVKYARIIIRWRDCYLSKGRDVDEIQKLYEHFDEPFQEKWYDEAIGAYEEPHVRRKVTRQTILSCCPGFPTCEHDVRIKDSVLLIAAVTCEHPKNPDSQMMVAPTWADMLAHPLSYQFNAVLPEFEPWATEFKQAQDKALEKFMTQFMGNKYEPNNAKEGSD